MPDMNDIDFRPPRQPDDWPAMQLILALSMMAAVGWACWLWEIGKAAAR